MKNFKKIISAGIAAVMLIMAGCAPKNAPMNNSNGNGRKAEIPKTLSIFCVLGGYAVGAGLKSNNEILSYQLIEELTGCHVEWIHPPNAAVAEKFNLMITAGNLPDMIVYNWAGVPGGINQYIDDGIILPLNELIDNYMPNLKALNERRPDIKKQYTLDDGRIVYIPLIRDTVEDKIFQGPIIREDWLDKLGLEVPKTTDDLYNILKAFKTRDPNGNGQADEIPMGASLSDGGWLFSLFGSFGTNYGFYLKDGEVKYGILEDRFKEGLEYLAKLYREGLLEPDYLTDDRQKLDAKIMNDKVGFTFHYEPSDFYASSLNDGTRKVTGIPHLTGPYGDNSVNYFYPASDIGVGIAITKANKNPEGSVLWLDNFFGGKGYEYMNFGKEGVTFNWVDGYPVITDYILNNPDMDMATALAVNFGTRESKFPVLMDVRVREQCAQPWGRNAMKTWYHDFEEHGGITYKLPPIMFTEEENKIMSQIMSQVNTYTSEAINKIVLGQDSIDSLPRIREYIKKMGIDSVLKIYNDSYERYIKR